MNAAIYLRKSRADIESEKLGELETLSRHDRILTNLCEKQGITIVEKYREIVSGESIQNRPEMIRLLEDVRSKKYEAVVVMEIERLARGNTSDQGIVFNTFKYTGTKIVTPVKTYDPNNSFDEEFFEFGLFMSRREYKTINRRLETGRKQSASEGNYIFPRIPFGYDKKPLYPNGCTIVPNQYADVVKWIYNEYLSGTGIERIAYKLTERGIPTYSGNPWKKATVKGILQNELYTGIISFGKTKTVRELNDSGSVSVVRKSNSEGVVTSEGKHESIIDRETFQAVQEKFKRSVPTVSTDLKNPLAGILRCSRCNMPFIYDRYDRYKKNNVKPTFKHPVTPCCKSKSVNAEMVMNAIIDLLEERIQNFDIDIEEEKPINNEQLYQNQLQSVKIQYNGIFDKLERGIYSEGEFVERKKILLERISELEKTILEERSKLEKWKSKEDRKHDFAECIRLLKSEDVSASVKNDFFKKIFEKITMSVEDLGRMHGSNITLDIYFQ